MRELVYQPAALRPLLSKSQPLSQCLLIGESGSGRTTLANLLAIRSGAGCIERVSCSDPLGPIRRALFKDQVHQDKRTGRVVIVEELCASDLVFQDELMAWLRETKGALTIICTARTRIYSLIRSGDFRLSLYALLATPLLRIPPLAERPEDIVALAYAFLERWQHSDNSQKRGLQFSEAAIRSLFQYDWPGNVSELQEVVATAALRTHYQGRNIIDAEDIQSATHAIAQATETAPLWQEVKPLREAVREFERNYLRSVLSTSNASGVTMAETCKRLGVGRTTLWRKLIAEHHWGADSERAWKRQGDSDSLLQE